VQDAAKHRMLEHVGEIAGMESVAIVHVFARKFRRSRTLIGRGGKLMPLFRHAA
jgi:hypothetical protein